MTRSAWGSLSRDQIIDTAVRLLRTEGFEHITIRALAREMGVGPMSLYRHVTDKDDILEEVVERLLANRWRPRRGRGDRDDWKDWIADTADRLRRLLVDQPAALHVYLRRPVTSPSALARMEAVMDVLRDQLGSQAAAERVYGALQTYTIGFAALQASRKGWTPEEQGDPVARQLAAYATPAQFATGLRYLLDGAEASIDR